MRQTHVAGEKLFVDYAGDTVPVFDGATDEERPAHVFAAVLGASNDTYAEARWSEGLADWIGAHVNALAFLGRVPELLVCDNLRAGVAAACRATPGAIPAWAGEQCWRRSAQLAQWHETPAHFYQNYQAAIRLMVKLRFLLGLARRIAETIGTTAYPAVMQTLGELAADTAMIEAFVLGMEAKGTFYGPYFVPDRGLLYATQVQAQKLYPRMIATIRELAGGGVLMLPSSVADFADPENARLIGRTQHGAVGSGMDRVKLMKLAWDALGSEFGSRHVQYEMFYSGPRTTTAGMAYRTCDWDRATAMLETLLGSYDAPVPAGA